MKSNYLKFGLLLLTIFIFNSCGKDEEVTILQEQNSIKIKIEDKIENEEVENLLKSEIKNIKYQFSAYTSININSRTNDSTSLQEIEINTEAFSIIEDENGEDSYTFEVDFPNGSLDNEIINIHLYYNENNELKTRLIGYDLTQEEMQIAISNQSFDGFWDKIYYLELEDVDTSTAESESSRLSALRHPCDGIFNCETTGGSTWTPSGNSSGYGGSSGPGSSYSLPPLNTLPPSVYATLLAAGAITNTSPSSIPGGNPSYGYTTPVNYFSVSDLTIPTTNPSYPAIPFNSYYSYSFPGLKNVIKGYYEKVYVSYINSYITSSQTTITDHIVKQKAVYDFFQFLHTLQSQSSTSSMNFYYLASNPELTEGIFNFLAKNNTNYLDYVGAKNFANDIITTIRTDSNIDAEAFDFILEALNQNKIYNEFDYAFLNSVNQFMDINATASNPGLIQLQVYFSTKCAVLKYNHPNWSDGKIYWEASKDFIHIALDGFGLIPVVGEIADLTNGVLYLIEGDGLNATLSFAATIPIAGWTATGAKYGIKIANAATTVATKVKLVWKVTANGIEFGQRSQLRKVLGLVVGNPNQAHHIIPWAKRTNEVVQQAAKSGNAFHMNEALNGIAVAAWRNQPNHNLYNQKVQALFDGLPSNLTPDEAYTNISSIVDTIRNAIVNNPNTHLNDLIF